MVHATWTLRSSGQIVSSGQDNREEDLGGNTGKYAFRTLGHFHLMKSQTYNLDVNFTADGSALARLHPHLKIVAIDGGFLKDQEVYLFFLYLPLAVLLAASGFLLLLLSLIFNWRSKTAH